VAAIILHSSPADIETVIVDGIVRKRDGKLLPVDVDGAAKETISKESLEWGGIAREIVSSRSKMQEEISKIDYEEARESLMKLWHVDQSKLVDV
jgi:hypothetical protein